MSFTNTLLKIWKTRFLNIKQVFSFDLETTGFDPKTCIIFSYCLCDEEGNVTIYRLDLNKKDHKKGWAKLQEIFNDTSIAKLCHNYKFELSWMREHGIYVPPDTVFHDTMLMSRILQNLAHSHTLPFLGKDILDYEIETPFGVFDSEQIDEMVKTQAEARGGRFDRVEKTLMHYYQVADAERPMVLFHTWWPIIKNNSQLLTEYIVEILVSEVSLNMENRGMRIHKPNIEGLIYNLTHDLEKIREDVFYTFGEYLNLNSDIDLHRILFKILSLPVLKTSGKTGEPVTDKDVILEYKRRDPDNELFDWIIKTRSYTTGVTNLESYLELADENGIIHPKINSCQARTHRQSASKPNLQNVSKKEALKNLFPVPARRGFQPKVGHFMVLGDYSGIEMCLIIELANSEKMIAHMMAGRKPHVEACKLFYGDRFISKGESKKLYGAGKNGHFALGYGAGVHKLASTLLIPEGDAYEGLMKYCDEYPEIAYLSKTIGKEVREKGFVTTPFGSKLYVPVRKGYTGLNYKIQNTAAKILKRAEINVQHYLQNKWSNDVELSMVVHDEVILDFPDDRYYRVRKDEILYDCAMLMVDMPEIKVPLEIEWQESHTVWDEKVDIPLQVKENWAKFYPYRMSKILKTI